MTKRKEVKHMNTLRQLFNFMPDTRHPRVITRKRVLIAGSLAALALGYAWAVFCILY
jgi:hypothetical protein